ncbi:ribonuclease P protein subunit [Nanohaloarchaea archaeon H01]|nr:ribonuclease P protein subunit [Nanohaloarchaea archaeon H01]
MNGTKVNINPENLPRHELIGLEAEVIKSADESQIGICGKVTDETKSMLEIDGKKVEKENCKFLFELPDGTKVELDGKLIDERPADRIDQKLPGKWDYIES